MSHELEEIENEERVELAALRTINRNLIRIGRMLIATEERIMDALDKAAADAAAADDAAIATFTTLATAITDLSAQLKAAIAANDPVHLASVAAGLEEHAAALTAAATAAQAALAPPAAPVEGSPEEEATEDAATEATEDAPPTSAAPPADAPPADAPPPVAP